MSAWLKPRKDGIEISVRLTPHSSHDKVDGLMVGADDKTHLAVRVRAVPEKGKANAALEKLIAQWVGTAKRSVALTGGSTSRIKTVFISGDAALLEKWLRELTGDKTPDS